MNLEAQLQELALAEPSLEDQRLALALAEPSLEDQRLALADAEPSLDHYVREAPCEQLPQEVEEGNVEYKLKLLAVSDGEFFASEPGGRLLTAPSCFPQNGSSTWSRRCIGD